MVLTEEYWKERWARNETGWHINEYNPFLERHCLNFSGRVLVPLCGASFDLKWFASRENITEVIGVEISNIAIKQFSAWLGQTADVKTENGLKMHCFDKIKIIETSIFDPQLENVGKVDYIYDRGSYIAMNYCDQEKYTGSIKNFMDTTTTWLMAGIRYDVHKHPNPPPHIVDEEHVATKSWFSAFSYTLVEKNEKYEFPKNEIATKFVWLFKLE